MVFMADSRKAFDFVDRSFLLHKLKNIDVAKML